MEEKTGEGKEGEEEGGRWEVKKTFLTKLTLGKLISRRERVGQVVGGGGGREEENTCC